jgi:hypothetical protein
MINITHPFLILLTVLEPNNDSPLNPVAASMWENQEGMSIKFRNFSTATYIVSEYKRVLLKKHAEMQKK